MPRLLVTSAEGESTVDLASGDVVTIGRDPSNRVPLPTETRASRRHCRIGRREGQTGWEVVDLGSTNKTRVNGAVVERRALAHGDVVEVGDVKIRFEDEEEEKRLAEMGRQGICYLEWANKEHKGEKVLLSAPRTSFGRRESNTVRLDDRMASGHHAEIVRDLNGYTLRDLGSTNGTLLNGEPISEGLLAHGARVRIGNSRFLFKDPSMKDIEVELAQFDEDEGWGMMGEIDLSRARGSYAGILTVLVLFLAAGAGGWWLTQQAEKRATGPALELGEIENGSFDGEIVLWSAENDELATVRRDAQRGRSGAGLVLQAKGEEGTAPALVTYGEVLEPVGTRPFRIRAALRGTGDPAPELVLIWGLDPTPEQLKAGATPLARTEVLGRAGGAWRQVEASRVPPAWARAARLGVRLPPGTTATLDDVQVEIAASGAPLPSLTPPGASRTAQVTGAGEIDVFVFQTLLVGAVSPTARLADGTPLRWFDPAGPPTSVAGGIRVEGSFRDAEEPVPARVTWSVTEEGLGAAVTCEQAAETGLSFSLVGEHLSGVLSVLGDFPPQRLSTEQGERLERVARVLAGDPERVGARPPTLVNLQTGDGSPTATLVLAASPDAGLVVVELLQTGSEARLAVVTDFTLQRRQAQEALTDAKALSASTPGRAIAALRNVAQAYPFDEAVRDEALGLAARLEETARADVEHLERALAAYRIYRSESALEELTRRAADLKLRFLGPGHGSGPLESQLADLVAQAEEARRDFEVQRALPDLDRLERIVDLLAATEGYRPLAALYARALLKRHQALAQASSDVERRLAAVRERLDKLMEDPAVASAMPPPPIGAGGP